MSGEDSIIVIKPDSSPINTGSPQLFDPDVGIDLYIKNDALGDASLRLETDAAGKDAVFKMITANSTWSMTNAASSADELIIAKGGTSILTLEDGGDVTVNGTLTAGLGGSPDPVAIIANGDIVMNSQMRASDGDVDRPAYSFASSTSARSAARLTRVVQPARRELGTQATRSQPSWLDRKHAWHSP